MRINSENDLDQCIHTAKLLATIASWTELGLWHELDRAAGPVDLSELEGDPRALAITAPILAHAGLLIGHGSRWTLSEVGRDLLRRGALPTGQNLSWLRQLGRLGDVLRAGGPVVDDDGNPVITSGGVKPDDPEATRRFLDMLYRRSERSAKTAADWVTPRIASGGHILDVGGGHGRYARTFADRGLRATIFDLPLVIDLAKERHGDHVGYRAGNFHTDDFGGPYDGAFLSNIVHGESEANNRSILSRLHDAIVPGGLIVIKDMFIHEQGCGPTNAVHFGLTMLYYTRDGKSYSIDDLRRWFDDIGFTSPEVIGMENHCLVFGRRR